MTRRHRLLAARLPKAIDVGVEYDAQTIVHGPKPKAMESWWLGKSREELSAAAEREVPRMRESKFAFMLRMNTD